MIRDMNNINGPLVPYWELVRDRVNESCEGVEPWKIIVYSCGTTLLVLTARDILFSDEDTFTNRTKKEFFRLMKKIPFVKKRIAEEKKKILKDMEHSMNADVDGYVTQLPAEGLKMETLMEELKRYQGLAKVNWSDGTISGTVYSGDPELTHLMEKVYGMFAWTNPLHSDVFPDIRKMEAEVVRMCCTMFNGDKESCGTMTSGGTESILMACFTYRNIARERGIKIPEIIVPITAHAAFDKAAAYFHMKITHIPINEETRKVDINAMRRAINKNTCVLVGSAPQFPHGIIDDIQAISELGLKYDIPVHVDCCLGGFLYPFMEKAGFSVPVVDFRVPGVTSISADTHKYAFAPKGSSVILYRKDDYRKFQFFVQPDWPGGIYATAAIGGSRPGAIIAVCWGTLMYFGEKGYVETTKKIISTARYIKKELKKIPGIHVYGDPLMSVVGFGPAEGFKYNIFTFSDMIAKRGWNLNPLQFPSSIHLCVTLLHTKEGVADQFIKDARECLEELLNSPDAEAGGMAAMYGTSQSIPDRSMVAELAGCFVSALYTTNKSTETNGSVPKQ
ncbi:sphingosine-1-phosphate lyase 1-like isoform X2 [Crassostrea angulata]|uniref:sphingosine-1-phosphate lyase 1-like isoform X2 n=1 Tax=Magallana angulata TaxID=2784310 RepID=UPI0022B0EB51|nr:sphingosine-1-phosphate lyase 1-like isoform X2 [Crassostrea angulata]